MAHNLTMEPHSVDPAIECRPAISHISDDFDRNSLNHNTYTPYPNFIQQINKKNLINAKCIPENPHPA